MATKYLDNTGLSYFWSKLKAYFAPKAHTHNAFETKHSYTVAANAAKNWYRIANASTQQLDTSKPIRAQFIVTAYNTSYAADYYETWFVNAIVFGRTAHIVIFGGSNVPFSQARIIYENTVANIDANDRPAIDLYLNYVLPNGTTKIEVEEIYNNGGWAFVADGQLAASSVPSGFESVACGVRNNGVDRSTTADYASYLNRQISNFTAAFTLADSYLYRSRTLNCTGTFTITIPSINSGYMWCVIKNKNTSSGVITLHPSTTSVLIDGSNADITLQPMEYVCIHSAGANNYSLIADGRFSSKTVAIANKLGTATVGASDAPIYLNAGVPTVTGGRLNRSLAQYVAADGYSDVFQTYQSDNNNYRSCTIRCTNGNGFNEILIGAHNESNAAPSGITVRSTNGTLTTGAPTPAVADNSTKIATTAWVRTATGNFACNAATASAVAWSGVTGKPTTIAGYGITDAKISNGTITLGSNSITPLTSVPSHNQASNTINAMTGYSKPSATSAITAGDTLNQAVGKLEKAIDDADISNVVHITGTETISGAKTFTSKPSVIKDSPQIYLKDTAITRSMAPEGAHYIDLIKCQDSNEKELFRLRGGVNTDRTSRMYMALYNGTTTTETDNDFASLGIAFLTDGTPYGFAPTPPAAANSPSIATTEWVHAKGYLTSHQSLDNCMKTNSTNSVSVFHAFHRSVNDSGIAISGGNDNAVGAYLELYGPSYSSTPGRGRIVAKNSSTAKVFYVDPGGTAAWNGQVIQTSSDERLKTPISDIDDDVLDVWEHVKWGEFKYLDAVAEKGAEARCHVGLTAQSVDRVFKEHGIDILKYGILCHEESETAEDSIDLWMVRYTEALCMEAACQRRRADRLEARIKALEARVDG